MRLSSRHHRVTSPYNCECFLCQDWQRAQSRLHEIRLQAPNRKVRIEAERRALVTELRIDLWSELCWYAEREQWLEGWIIPALQLIFKSDRLWVMRLQYRTMGDWLYEFLAFQRNHPGARYSGRKTARTGQPTRRRLAQATGQ